MIIKTSDNYLIFKSTGLNVVVPFQGFWYQMPLSFLHLEVNTKTESMFDLKASQNTFTIKLK